MDVGDLLTKTECLSIGEDDIDACLLIFEQGHVDAGTEKTKNLVKCSKSPEVAPRLLKLYEDDPKMFFTCLGALGTRDTRIVLVNVLSTAVPKALQEVTGLRALNIIKKLLKDVKVDDYKTVLCYMQNYCNIMVNFRLYLPQHIGLFLSFLYPESEKDYATSHESNSSIVLTVMTLYSEEKEETKEQVSDYIEILVDGVDPDTFPTAKFLNFIKIMSLLYTPMTEVIHPTYVSKQTQDIMVLKINSILRVPTSLSQQENKKVVREILKLLGDTCVNDQSRDFNATHYLEPIKLAITVDDVLIKYLATLDLIKLWNFVKIGSDHSEVTSIDNMLFIVVSFLRSFDVKGTDSDMEFLGYNIESLSYLSLNESIKTSLRQQEDLLEKLVSLLDSSSVTSSVLYGVIIIISNLMEPKKAQTPNERAIQQMKTSSTETTAEEIRQFRKSMLLNHKVVQKLCLLPTKNELVKAGLASGARFYSLYMDIFSQITSSQDKQVRQEVFNQGAYSFVSKYLMKNSEMIGTLFQAKDHDETAVNCRHNALRTLARIIIANNPQLLEDEKLELTVVFLVELLGAPIDQYEGKLFEKGNSLLDKVTIVDKYEALLALTNLASIDNGSIRKIIITKTFDQHLNNFIIDSDNSQLQRASWELVSNLISEPMLMAKFFNVEGTSSTQKANYKRLLLLIKLLNSTDESLQITLTGLLANVTSQFPMISEILLNGAIFEDLVVKMVQIFDHQAENVDLVYRSLVTVNELASNAEPTVLAKLKTAVEPSIEKLVRVVKDREVLLVVIDTLKLMRQK